MKVLKKGGKSKRAFGRKEAAKIRAGKGKKKTKK